MGEYFLAGNLPRLEHHIERCFEILDEYLSNEAKYHASVRLTSDHIVDLMEKE